MSNGIIYPTAERVFMLLHQLNLVEWMKRLVVYILEKFSGPLETDEKIVVVNHCIDTFIIFKWAFLMAIWVMHAKHPFVTSMIFYLLFFNVFTYFYHHVWKVTSNQSPIKARRRFITAITAVVYSILCYGYLYDVVFPHEFNWPAGKTVIEPLYFSLATSLTVTFGDVSLKSPIARILCCSQLINMFVFVATVLSPGVPRQTTMQVSKNEHEEEMEIPQVPN